MTSMLAAMPPAAPARTNSKRTGTLRYLRHGITAPNLAHVRCGGDLDEPLLDQGREQIDEAALQLAKMDPPIGLIITSDLRRTRESARIIAARLAAVEIHIVPGFAERRLGDWNLLSIEETQPWLDAGLNPPNGETDVEFTQRVARALYSVKPLLHLHPLLVGSKGVARVMGQMVGLPRRMDLGNAQIAEFKLAELPCLETTWGTL
ncbi:MAG: histidine phosphatase family protein [Rubrivivax sp.]|nr:histidine phosphatase family protein [Rubrivivax sp.]